MIKRLAATAATLALAAGALATLELPATSASPVVTLPSTTLHVSNQDSQIRDAETRVELAPTGKTWSQVLQQPGGDTFKATLTADNVGGLFETEQGYSIAKNAAGQWVYVSGRDAELDAILSQQVVGIAPPTGIAKHAGRATIKSSAAMDSLRASLQQQLLQASRSAQLAAAEAGSPRLFKVPALMLATWYDEANGQSTPQFQAGHDAEFFKKILDGFGGNPRGTVTEFYFENSFGQFKVQVDVYGPYMSAKSVGNPCYYGIEGGWVPDPGASQLGLGGLGVIGMATEVVPLASEDIGLGWGDYDNDGDGKVDFTIIIHSGGDAASTGNMCFTWSHAAQVTLGLGETAESSLGLPYGTIKAGIPTSTPGKVVDRAVTIPEFSSYTSPLTIGVAAHEMAHALGEPDYYDTGYTSTGTGDFDVMSGGSYGGNPSGSNPTLFNPASRVFQGWITPTVVHGDLRGYKLRPRNVTPYAGYRVGRPDPNLLLVPTYQIALGQTDKLGHVWTAADVYGLPKDPKTGKYIVEGFYIEYVKRNARAAKLHPASPRGAMFDRQHLASGVLTWHFDYWRQSTTYFGHGNSAQSDPNRYQMDLVEFDRNDNTQELQRNYGRGNPEDYLSPAATGITSGTFQLPPGIKPGKPQGPIELSGTTTLATPGTAEFTVSSAFNNASMAVTINSDNIGDCKLQLIDPKGKAGEEVDSGSAGDAETVMVANPMAGKWTAKVADFAACTSWAGRVVFTGTSLARAGAASTYSNWTDAPTGWAFTNVRGATDGVNTTHENGGPAYAQLDVVNLKGRKDVSPGFLSGTINVGQRNQLRVPIFSNGSKAPGKVKVLLKNGTRTVGTTTVTLGAYGRKIATFPFQPATEGPLNLSVVVDPANAVGEAIESNNKQVVTLWAGPAKPRVLIVDDDGQLQRERAVAGALAALKIPYAISANDHPNAATLKKYKAVVWSSGLDRGPGQIDEPDRAALTAYLEAGGRLLLTSNRAIETTSSKPAPQSTDAMVNFASRYLGIRNGVVLSMPFPTKISGTGFMKGSVWPVKVPPGRAFVSIAQLTGNGTNANGVEAPAFGKVTGVAKMAKVTLDEQGLVDTAAEPLFMGVAVDGNAAHHGFRTITLGWNVGDAVSMSSTIDTIRRSMAHLGIKAGGYTAPRKPLIFVAPSRDSVSRVTATVSAIVVGGTAGKTVVAKWRTPGTTTWHTLVLRRVGTSAVYQGVLPKLSPSSIEFYVVSGTSRAPYGPAALNYPIAVAPPELGDRRP